MLHTSFNQLFQNITRNKVFSFLNIGGLALGITCASFIFLWVENELSFNHNFSKRNSVYAVIETQEESTGQLTTQRGAPVPLAEGIKHKIPGIKNTARIGAQQEQFFVVGEKIFTERGQYADSSILSLLNLQFIYGAAPSLTAPESIVISSSMATAIFGNTNPVGKTLLTRTGAPAVKDGLFTITGVFKDLPFNNAWHFNWLSSYTIAEGLMHAQWNKWDIPVETLVELEPQANIAAVNSQLSLFVKEKSTVARLQLFLFSMNDWNLYSHFTNGKPDQGKIQYIRLFALIAGIILLIACINFINLSTARSEKRAKEVGIRKVSGARRHELVGQFLGESLTMAFLSVLLSMILISLFLPVLNSLLGTKLEAGLFYGKHLLFLIGTGLFCGLVSGLYPAFYLSSFRPVAVLKGVQHHQGAGPSFIRKGLVIVQFTVSIVLMIATVIIFGQIQYVKTRDLGYKTNRMIEMVIPATFPGRFEVVRQELLQSGAIQNAAMAYNPMLHLYSYSNDYNWRGKSPRDKIIVYDIGVSTQYLATMQMKLTAGRDFYPGERIDSNNTCIVNETLAKLMGAEGKTGGTITRAGFPPVHIVGIVQDFIFNDMYGSGGPVLIGPIPQACNHLFITLSPAMTTRNALAKVDQVLTATMPGYPFTHHFVDEELDQLFETENMINVLASIFALVAILISCLGLFGLAAYTAERRTKEIGIRKVLGATVISVIRLFSAEFLQLVFIACLMAFPLAWWAANAWLQGYQYRINVHWWPFAAAGFTALLIAWITVSVQVFKTAVASPVKSLRTE